MKFVVAVGAVVAGEAGVEVATVEEGGDGGGGWGSQAGEFPGVVVKDLPDGRGAGLTGAVADAGSFRRGRS